MLYVSQKRRNFERKLFCSEKQLRTELFHELFVTRRPCALASTFPKQRQDIQTTKTNRLKSIGVVWRGQTGMYFQMIAKLERKVVGSYQEHTPWDFSTPSFFKSIAKCVIHGSNVAVNNCLYFAVIGLQILFRLWPWSLIILLIW